MNNTPRPVAVGDVLHGFCGGIFGRDHHDCCTVEAVGRDWVVTRNDRGGIDFASNTGVLQDLAEHRTPELGHDCAYHSQGE